MALFAAMKSDEIILYLIAGLILYQVYTTAKGELQAVTTSQETVLDLVRKYGGDYPNVDDALVMAVIERESNFNPSSYNPKDPSYGLMAIMIPTARDMGYSGDAYGLFDPDTNVQLGYKYLDWLGRQTNYDIHAMLQAYNGGIGNLQRGTVTAGAMAYDAAVTALYTKWSAII